MNQSFLLNASTQTESIHSQSNHHWVNSSWTSDLVIVIVLVILWAVTIMPGTCMHLITMNKSSVNLLLLVIPFIFVPHTVINLTKPKSLAYPSQQWSPGGGSPPPPQTGRRSCWRWGPASDTSSRLRSVEGCKDHCSYSLYSRWFAKPTCRLVNGSVNWGVKSGHGGCCWPSRPRRRCSSRERRWPPGGSSFIERGRR